MDKISNYSIQLSQLFKELNTSQNGLTNIEAEKHLANYGLNTIVKTRPIPFLKIIFEQFTDLLIILLIGASFISFLLGDLRNGYIILAIVFLNAVIGFSQEYKSQRIVKALEKFLPNLVRVKRDGTEKLISSHHLVPGDIIILGSGDKIPADIQIIECYDLNTDEKTLTGETHLQIKNAGKNSSDSESQLFAGTIIVSGEALGLVIKTGLNTEFGKIAQKTTKIEESHSPFQDKINSISRKVAFGAILIMLVLIIYHYYTRANFIDGLIFSVAVAAALVPEGLPATISIALSLGAHSLAKNKALVKNLISVETLGSTTVICTDKTGTLTTGEMTVEEVWSDISELKKEEKERLIKEAFVLCNDAQIGKNTLGDPTEIALLNWVDKNYINISEIKNNFLKTDEIPFNSQSKFMTVFFKEGNRAFSYTKGAPEVIMRKCHLDNKEKEQINKRLKEFGQQGFRVLAFARNEIFLCLAAIYDPPRPGIENAIKECQRGGIKVLMVTGDNPETASSIAKMAGLIDGNQSPQVILGSDLEKMSNTKLRDILLGEPIFARVNPEHKFKIVDNLRNMGEVVAVTGDGVNDAPALKRADIGVAMGKTGTDVSREAADMVLLDDNFSNIVKAVKEGRVIFDNIKKFIFFIFAHNFGELMIVVLGMLLNLPLPMLAVQILAVDLGTDIFPSMALIGEKENKVMQSKPRSRDIKLLNKNSILHLLIIGFIISIGAIWNFTSVLQESDYSSATTVAFSTLAACQLINVFFARTSEKSILNYPFWQNKYLFLGVCFSFTLLLLFIYNGFFNNILGTNPFPSIYWVRILLIGLILFIFEEIFKFILRKNGQEF